MTRRKAKWVRPEPKILATADSKRVMWCYATQGKAYTFHPGYAGRCTIVLVNKEREVLCVTRNDKVGGYYPSDEVPLGEWRVLGWIPCDGKLPHGDLESVDPDLADFDVLPLPNVLPPRTHSIRPNLVIDIVPWDADGKPEYD